LSDLTRLQPLDLLRYLPPLISCLTIPAFALLSRSLLGSNLAAASAVFAFALLPSSFRWGVMGGGLTRSLGYLLALLALHRLYALYRDGGPRQWIPTSILMGLTVLSHPEAALFASYSSALLMLLFGRCRQGVVRSCLVVAGTLAVSSPWWATVLLRHGVSPFVSGMANDNPPLMGLAVLIQMLIVHQEPFFQFIGTLAFVGTIWCLRSGGRWWIPAWVAVMYGVNVRSATTTASVPMALLAGIGFEQVVGLLLDGDRSAQWSMPRAVGGENRIRFPRSRVRLVVVVTTLFLMQAGYAAVSAGGPWLDSLPAAERAAMAWVSHNTPEDGVFLVVPSAMWGIDRSAEWFPALAGRASVSTVQGYEWLPGFGDKVQSRDELLAGIDDGAGTLFLEDWERKSGTSFTHLYLPKNVKSGMVSKGSTPLLQSLMSDADYSLLYDGPGAMVFSRVR
ncbi:MAG TPA: hypothetical protein VHS28_03005, partial [Chloroflexota bacterium]|nr:hypothetical protein [Chloroflexota bacterium]